MPTTDLVPSKLATAVVVAAAAVMLCAPVARADDSTSSNWAGYAVHRSGVKFTKIVAMWRQPAATCSPGRQTYSAVWVGLGGYSLTSNALEQIGTEVDCSASGKVLSSAWYELVPELSQTIGLIVHPHDQLSASVTVTGHTVALTLRDLTRHRGFSRTVQAPVVDVSSAEWIVEAPSDCFSDGSCETLPLADFGSATFDLASARSGDGHTGPISDPAWNSTRITLGPDGRHYVVYQPPGAPVGTATPSALTPKGNSFKVTYRDVSLQVQPTFSRQSRSLRAGHLVHPTF
ncbi:MAG: hypothetical protein JO206_09020 [Solirubrobacterales bacterium]|nr:hypothetical protein [Solirubrobacterales bacterium]